VKLDSCRHTFRYW